MSVPRRSRRSFPLKRISPVVAVSLLASLSPGRAAAQVDVGLEARTLSRYLFAGLPFSTGWVGQGQVVVSVSGFTFNGYTNYDFDTEEINELDIWGDYFHVFSDVFGAYVGAGLYNFKNVVEVGEYSATPELYGGVAFFTVLNPSLYVAHDFDLGDGTHAYASLSHDVPVGIVTFTGTGRLAYNAHYWREGSGFSYADLNVAAAVPFGIFTFTPSVDFVGSLDDDDFIDVVVWGASLRADF
ncbi:MAG: hypothetical protein R3195_01745 [Gemmatimonadota bacterium]|nr:hypothetical protein [Gemmatimonadota bacterium]